MTAKKFEERMNGVLCYEKNLRWDIASLPLGTEEDDGTARSRLVVLVCLCWRLGCSTGWRMRPNLTSMVAGNYDMMLK